MTRTISLFFAALLAGLGFYFEAFVILEEHSHHDHALTVQPSKPFDVGIIAPIATPGKSYFEYVIKKDSQWVDCRIRAQVKSTLRGSLPADLELHVPCAWRANKQSSDPREFHRIGGLAFPEPTKRYVALLSKSDDGTYRLASTFGSLRETRNTPNGQEGVIDPNGRFLPAAELVRTMGAIQ